MGGIINFQDALEYIMAGATAVAVGTGQFVNPHCCPEIINDLEQYCREKGIAKITQLKGVAL